MGTPLVCWACAGTASRGTRQSNAPAQTHPGLSRLGCRRCGDLEPRISRLTHSAPAGQAPAPPGETATSAGEAAPTAPAPAAVAQLSQLERLIRHCGPSSSQEAASVLVSGRSNPAASENPKFVLIFELRCHVHRRSPSLPLSHRRRSTPSMPRPTATPTGIFSCATRGCRCCQQLTAQIGGTASVLTKWRPCWPCTSRWRALAPR